MNPILPAALAAALLVLAAPAAAVHGERYGDEPRYDIAKVERVEPVVEVVSEPVYSRYCREEPVYEPVYEEVYEEGYYDGGYRGGQGERVLGAIAGGLIGNQFGHGDGRVAATFFGTVLGDALVADHQARRSGYQSGYRSRYPVGERVSYRERCDTHTRYVREEHVRSYDVTYRYQGRLYHTRTAFDPGDSLRVRVDVMPVE